ncbi:MAG TPA: RNA methyltransferase [Puia sp.]|nr:RNA methyltransferase [Puia sp.]
MLITKTQVKYIQSLGHKKFRDAEGVFVVEGPKITEELLAVPRMRPRAIYALPEWIQGLPAGLGKEVLTTVGAVELGRLSALTTPNQVIAVFEKPVFGDVESGTGIHLVLDGIQDPGNLGTIVRLADWFGVASVLCTPDCADVYNAKAVQSTMGSIGRVPVIYGDPAASIRGRAGVSVYATVLEGESVYGMGEIERGFIVVGNESRGIGPELLGLATRRVRIPRVGGAESLNAAVATGIVLSHLSHMAAPKGTG